MTHLLTISGSLRAGSSNATLLAAVARLAPERVTTMAFAGLADLPAFNPDLEEDATRTPSSVIEWRRLVERVDALLISSPEYIHGIPGALKNALDWLVGAPELVGKRVGLLNASSVSRYAHPQLLEVLTTMSFEVVPGASVLVDIPRRGADVQVLADDPKIAAQIRDVLAALFPIG